MHRVTQWCFISPLALVILSTVIACHRQMIPAAGQQTPAPDPLISGQRLSVWITSLEDHDPETQLKALQAMRKLETPARRRTDGTIEMNPRATEAEAAYQPLKAMAHRPLTFPVALAVQYDLFVLFRESDPHFVKIALKMLTDGNTEESLHASSLLESYPSAADQITDAALAMVMRTDVVQASHGTILLCHYPAQGWPKIANAQFEGGRVDQVLFESARQQVREAAAKAGLLQKDSIAEATPPPNYQSTNILSTLPDWDALTTKARSSAQAWEGRYWQVNSQYATRFAHVPRDVTFPVYDHSAAANAAADNQRTPEGRFQLWDQRGKAWRAAAENLERRLQNDQP